MGTIVTEATNEILEQEIVKKKLSKKADKTPVEKKKGQPVNWKPASRLPKLTAPEGFVPRWVENTPERVRKAQAEGWIVANRLEHNMDVEMGDYYKKINDKPVSELSSNITHNEMIAAIMPIDVAESRKAYYRNETEQQTRTKLMPEKSASSFIRDMAGLTTKIEIN
jgi:hypothetical protein